MNTDQLARLKTIHATTDRDTVNYDVVLYRLEQQEEDNKRFAMAAAVSARPMC